MSAFLLCYIQKYQFVITSFFFRLKKDEFPIKYQLVDGSINLS